jgi:hypothetical protein
MISPRFVPATCVLVALSLVPTLIHSYAGVVVDDGRTAAAVPDILAGFTALPTSRSATWGQRRFGSDDWVERRYRNGVDEAVLTVVRSYDAKTVYHHPELAVAYGTGFESHEVRRFDAHPDLPVHVLSPMPGVSATAVYVLRYDDRFIESPVLFQLRNAGELLVSGRKPMTLFFVLMPQRLSQLEGSAPLRVLFAAVDAFVAQQTHSSPR